MKSMPKLGLEGNSLLETSTLFQRLKCWPSSLTAMAVTFGLTEKKVLDQHYQLPDPGTSCV